MPVIRVSWWVGRPAEDKAKVAVAITEALTSVGIPAEATHVIFEEVPREDWFIGGTSAARRPQPPRD